jgi:uncharacterized protein YbaR (Trm112 family)
MRGRAGDGFLVWILLICQDMSNEVISIPACPVCGHNDSVAWLSAVERDGQVVAERWVCEACSAKFGFERRAEPQLWKALVIAALAIVPALWWLRHRKRVNRHSQSLGSEHALAT